MERMSSRTTVPYQKKLEAYPHRTTEMKGETQNIRILCQWDRDKQVPTEPVWLSLSLPLHFGDECSSIIMNYFSVGRTLGILAES